jgi:hypothetical protein
LTHPAGVERGASKQVVYDGTRLEVAEPTRLFVDAESTAGWRARGFFSVIEARGAAPVMLRLLDLHAAQPLAPNQSLPDDLEIGIRRQNQCPRADEVDKVAGEHPHLGMPFAFSGLAADDVALIRAWIAQGARADADEPVIADDDRAQIALWERWLNDTRPERAIVARWLYEHWAIARLYFDRGASGRFFRLVRSTTPPGQAVDEIATRNPNSDPGGSFFYRFRPHLGTRVYKTHITFPLNEEKLQRIEDLFFDLPWELAELPGYSESERANPFTTFAAIPPGARYRFMLEHAGYFVRTFIRGPVCRGQLATDVIRDHFWVMFQAPGSDPYIADKGFREKADPLLVLPGLADDLIDGAERWLESTAARNRYVELRQQALATLRPAGAAIEAIWDGDGVNENALLTVFRHHDSATVGRGWLGQLPLTVWWMDYPLFERSYYDLVVNFDVFGTVAHQVQTRLYFDLIRNGAEHNFLRLLPPGKRQEILNGWYSGSGLIKLWINYQEIDTEHPTAIVYATDSPKSELLEKLLLRFAHINRTADPINRPSGRPGSPRDALLSTLIGVPAAEMRAITHLPDASLLRVSGQDGAREIYTLVRNRRHTNVAFVLGESLRYEPEKDALSIVPGVATAYPNFIFDVPVNALTQFAALLRGQALEDRETFVRRLVEVWGVRRTSPQFWSRFQDINDYLNETDPIEAGILDLNRYIDY